MQTTNVKEFVLRLIEKKGKLPESVDVESFDYVDSGHVDSIGLIKFVLAIESEFNVEISESDMESAEFRTVGGLLSMIDRKIASKA